MGQRSLADAQREYRDGYYERKLEEGQRYEDYVASVLYELGIHLTNLHSQHYQHHVGENLLGAEIKRDGMFRDTGRLYIETAEKSHPDNRDYVASGIHRGDNSWLYIIGDEQTIYVFSTKQLRKMASSGKYQTKQTHTSCGFVLPKETAEKWCLLRIDQTSAGPRKAA